MPEKAIFLTEMDGCVDPQTKFHSYYVSAHGRAETIFEPYSLSAMAIAFPEATCFDREEP